MMLARGQGRFAQRFFLYDSPWMILDQYPVDPNCNISQVTMSKDQILSVNLASIASHFDDYVEADENREHVTKPLMSQERYALHME